MTKPHPLFDLGYLKGRQESRHRWSRQKFHAGRLDFLIYLPAKMWFRRALTEHCIKEDTLSTRDFFILLSTPLLNGRLTTDDTSNWFGNIFQDFFKRGWDNNLSVRYRGFHCFWVWGGTLGDIRWLKWWWDTWRKILPHCEASLASIKWYKWLPGYYSGSKSPYELNDIWSKEMTHLTKPARGKFLLKREISVYPI